MAKGGETDRGKENTPLNTPHASSLTNQFARLPSKSFRRRQVQRGFCFFPA